MSERAVDVRAGKEIMTSVDGLSSGLDTTSIINQLMQLERLPQNRLANQRTRARSAETELKGLRSDINNMGDLASDLRKSDQWQKLSATSTDESVTPVAGAGQFEGAFSFSVTALATSHTVYSDDLFEDLAESGDGSGSVFSFRDTAALGISNLTATGLAVGDVAFEVTQSTEAATVVGGAIPAIPVTIDATNDILLLEVDGVSYELTLDHGGYDSEQALSNALSSAVNSDPGLKDTATVKLDESDRITISTVHEGSSHSIQITGGSGADVMGFSAGPGSVGVDGEISINGVLSAITDTSVETVTLLASADPEGPSIAVTMDGGLREGTADVKQTGFGDGSLQEIVNTINGAAGLAYSAAAVNTGNGFRLQLMATESGAEGAIDADLTAIAGISGFTTLMEAADAVLTVEGLNSYEITSSNNDFSDVLPGLDLTVTELTEEAVTVTIARDSDYLADKVGELVEKMNAFSERIGKATVTEPEGETAILHGNRSARAARDNLVTALTRPVEASSFGSLGSVGIELKRDGTLEFDRDMFLEALRDNSEELGRLFSQGTNGTGEDGVLDRVVEAVEGAAAFGDGYLYTAAESEGNRIRSYSDQIDRYEIRLELKEQSYRRTYANLEVLLGDMQRQQSNLSSQLGSLGGF